VEISGQGGWDDDSNYPDSLEREIVQAFDNVERVITAAGASWRGVYNVISYHMPMSDEALAVMVEQLRLRMPDQAPLWTCVGVPQLGDPKMHVEIVVSAMADE
jgi:enamine deaminase RidA (YjgF/YER057c/UK114 family)